jgi:ABC-type glycerol-3-phosphate transport system permease component
MMTQEIFLAVPTARKEDNSRWIDRLKSLGVHVALYGALTLISVFMIFPFIWMISTSLKPQSETFGYPFMLISPNMSLDGYAYILEDGVLTRLKNTAVIAFLTMVVTSFFSALGGYGFAKFRFPGRNALFMILLATLMIPPAVTILPKFLIILNIGWIDTVWSLVVPSAASAFGIFFMRQYISTIPDELLEAARLDGCSEFDVFRRVVLPVIRPGLISLGMIFFMGSWNNFLEPLIYLKSPENFTLPLMMMTFQGPLGTTAFRELMGIGIIGIAPLVIIFLTLQRRFIEGITAGAVKM